MVKIFINNPPTSLTQESGLEKTFLTNPGCWLERLPLDSWNQMNRAVTLLAQCWCGGAKERRDPQARSSFTCLSDMSCVNSPGVTGESIWLNNYLVTKVDAG